MQGKQVYEYTIIRFVPKVEREEFLNVGVMVYCKRKKYIGIRYKIEESRLACITTKEDLGLLKSHLSAWEKVANGAADGGPIAQLDQANRFRWLSANRSTIIQCSKIHIGLTEKPEEVLLDLLSRYVG